jgi:glycyl-tRNA synthetase
MRQLSRIPRATYFSSSPRGRSIFSTPPSLVHPTKSFTTTPAHCRFQLSTKKKGKDTIAMAGDMTTYKGKPFDRAALESLMRVRDTFLGFAPG